MTTAELWQEALAAAKPIAAEAHCRYCDPDAQDARLHCREDRTDVNGEIARAILRKAEAMREATAKAQSFWHWQGLAPWLNQRAAQYEAAAKEGG